MATDGTGRVLITGATGVTGGALVDALDGGALPFRVLCRREEQVRRFRERGVDAALGDLTSADAVRAAADGCDQLFLLPPAVEGLGDLASRTVEAARDAGVRHVLKIGASDGALDSPTPWAREHAEADRRLPDSGIAWTVLRPAAFLTNVLRAAPAIRRGVLPGISGRGRTAWIDPKDLALAAAAVLRDPTRQGGPGGDGRSVLLTGTEPLSFPDIAQVLSDRLGRRIRHVPVPPLAAELGARAAGVSPWMARGLVAQFAEVVRHERDGVLRTSDDLRDLLGRAPRDLAAFVDEHVDVLGRR